MNENVWRLNDQKYERVTLGPEYVTISDIHAEEYILITRNVFVNLCINPKKFTYILSNDKEMDMYHSFHVECIDKIVKIEVKRKKQDEWEFVDIPRMIFNEIIEAIKNR